MFLILKWGSIRIHCILVQGTWQYYDEVRHYNVILGKLTARFDGPEVMNLGAGYPYNCSTHYTCTASQTGGSDINTRFNRDRTADSDKVYQSSTNEKYHGYNRAGLSREYTYNVIHQGRVSQFYTPWSELSASPGQ